MASAAPRDRERGGPARLSHELALAAQSACDARALNLILFPTEQCNFRCIYCYEDFHIGKMRPHVISGVKNLIDARASELSLFDLSWFGGEPLLAKDEVVEIAGHAQRRSREHGFVYRSDMTTNGHLLDAKTAATLVDKGITRFQVTLDGPCDVHDRRRVKATGAGSFHRIWANLLAMRRSSLVVEMILRVHFSPDTIDELDPLIEDLNREFLEDGRFKVLFQPVEHLGGPNDAELAVFGKESKAAVKTMLEGSLSTSSGAWSPPGPTVCYAAKPNSLAVRADGSIAKCTVALADDRNRLGRLRPDGTLDLDQDKFRLWTRGVASLDEQELACPLSGM